MIDDLLADRVSIYRDKDDVFKQLALPVLTTPTMTFRNPIVVELEVPPGLTASFSVVGVLNGTGKSETVTFDGTIRQKVTLGSYTGLSTIMSLGGNASSATARLRNQSGQPYYTEYTVYTNIPARISKNEEVSVGKSLTMKNSTLQVQDNHTCFINQGLNKVKAKDRLTHLDTGDNYMVVAVDDVREYSVYHHTEMTIGLLEGYLKE